MGGEPVDEEDPGVSYWKEKALKAERELDALKVDTSDEAPGFEERKNIFDCWVRVFKKNANAKFKAGDPRDRKISARLKEWSAQELIQSINGYALDPWRHGSANRHEFATLIRSNAQIEQGIDIFSDGGKRAKSSRLNSPGNGKGPAGNSTVDYTDQDRNRVGGVTDFGGNTLRGPSPERPKVRRDDSMGIEDLF